MCGAPSAYTLAGPPERMSAAGARRATSSAEMSNGTISRVDAGLAHATRDELRVLRAEVEDEDGRLAVVLAGARHASGPSRRPASSAGSCPRSGATGRP